MKTNTFLLLLVLATKSFSQDTFSIVAADSATREVGSAGASCVDLFPTLFTNSFLGQLLPDSGAINTQASYLAANQNNARARMRAGDLPAQIISWLTANDAQGDSTIRQYGIVGFSGANVSAAGYTGNACLNYKEHRTGSINGIYYCIQGNILLGQQVIDSMESRFRNAPGNLTCRLMAALQGAKIIGADTRCTNNGTSSLFGFVKVSQPTDPYGNPSFNVSVRTHNNANIEPIDTLQVLFDAVNSCAVTKLTVVEAAKDFLVYPNPAQNELFIQISHPGKMHTVALYDMLGKKQLIAATDKNCAALDISGLGKGTYLIKIDGELMYRFVKTE
jgi:uncharacterized Ntn-hydrolase superfamily protein